MPACPSPPLPSVALAPLLAAPHLSALADAQVKKAGEPCKLYCKGRILGYKRCEHSNPPDFTHTMMSRPSERDAGSSL